MDKVMECKRALLEAVLQSPEYTAFEQVKEEIAGNQELRDRIDEFRKNVYIMQNTNDSIDRLDDMKALLVERERIHLDQMAARYLDAEAAYVHLIRGICLDVMNLSDLELDQFSSVIDV